MRGKKKRAANDDVHIKRKKIKKTCATDELLNENWESENSTLETAELLNAKTIREGMLLLGCVTEVKPTFLQMSLPGFLSGRVPLNNISSPFTKSLTDFATHSEMEEPMLSSLFKPGRVLSCRVIKISEESSKKRSSITLSVNPEEVNSDLKPSLLYPKMVLYVSVCSIEDHGCVVDVGNKYIQGFLPKKYYQDRREEFKIGEVILTEIERISSDKTSAKIQLSPINLKKPFPMIPVDKLKLNSILPGAYIQGEVLKITHPFIYLKYLGFYVCTNVLSLGKVHSAIQVGKKVCGTVLYVHPVTHMIYVTLKPFPQIFESKNLELRKFTLFNDLERVCSYKKVSYYAIDRNTLGFFHPKDQLEPASSTEDVPYVKRARFLRYHCMDNLIQLSAKKSLMETDIIFPENVKIGKIYNAAVLKHVHNGMFVRICPGLSGFVRKIYMSDVFVTKPEVLHPVGSKVQCMVLFTDGEHKLNLTCKESLLRLGEDEILSSYEDAQKGQFYKGVVAQKTADYILVLFFNDIKGIVPSDNVPKGSIFFVGQTVLCKVLSCNSLENKLRLSIEAEERYPIEKVEASWVESSSGEIRAGTLIKAVIKTVKGNQINIIMSNMKGRVHITELGCMSEGIYPLNEYSAGQLIQVYAIGDYTKGTKNYLEISHKKYISFKECSLSYPPYSLSQDFNIGKSLIGFVKEVHDVSVFLWLSPNQIGVLDFLHYSEDLKVIKSLHRSLKIGLSIKVSVLDNNRSTITLTKIEKILPQPGRNIIGLIQIPSSEGLVLKLPYGYHGFVAATDLTDAYDSVPRLLQKYCKSKFLFCHVLEVNHQTKYCQLSLRKSRVYGEKNTCSANFCPEITEDNIKVGDAVKGFVKSVSDSAIKIILGRNLMGKIKLHTCPLDNCRLCEISKNTIHNYPVGSIAKVIIKKYFADGRPCILDLADSKAKKIDKDLRLDVAADISWEDDE